MQNRLGFSRCRRACFTLTMGLFIVGNLETQSYADESQPLSLGVGAFVQNRAYGDTQTIPALLINYENHYIYLHGADADLKLPWISSAQVQFAVRANYGIEDGYKNSDTAILHGMKERKSSFWLGGAVDWNTDLATVSLEWLKDASSYSQGQKAEINISKAIMYKGLLFTPRIVGTWLSDDTVNYYYGVTAAEATLSRRAYKGESAFNVQAGLNVALPITANQTVLFDVGVTSLGGNIKDSPIVKKSVVTGVGIGYSYQF